MKEVNGEKRVLFLGAGASADSAYELPVMSSFFGPDLEDYPHLDRFLSVFYGEADRRLWNLEEVLSHLELSQSRLTNWGIGAATDSGPGLVRVPLDRAYNEAIEYMRKRLRIPPDVVCDRHRALFLRLQDSDSILSLNYDLVADSALAAVETERDGGKLKFESRTEKVGSLLRDKFAWGAPPTLHPREKERGFYLKLHGSLDWIHCQSHGCPNNVNVYQYSASSRLEGQNPGEPCRHCGSALRVLVVPPVSRKRIDDAGRINFLWNIALRELRQATSLVAYGISLAPTDFELRWLIREGLPRFTPTPQPTPRVHVVNPCAEHRSRWKELFASTPGEVFEHKSLDEYLRTSSSNE